jgi:hypothetical protein
MLLVVVLVFIEIVFSEVSDEEVEDSAESALQRLRFSVYSAARHKKRLTSKAVMLQVRKDVDVDDDDAAMVLIITI